MTDVLASYWQELVTAALLGTDRRDPPSPPPGPLADVVADTARTAPSARMLASVAACAVARRAGIRPLPPSPALQPPAPDDRPLLPAPAAARWRQIVTHWPVLEDEWLDAVAAGGWRLAPDVLVDLLRRHRGDASRRGRVEHLAGPIVDWLVEHLPELAATRPPAPADGGARPELPVSPELAALLAADDRTVASTLAAGLAGGRFGPPHRAVLVNALARVRPGALPRLVDALQTVDPASPSIGLGLALADLAATRQAMLLDFEVTK